MIPLFRYSNARLLAYSVKKDLETQGIKQISARPWNKFDPDNTLWWIVPAADWPAYRCGKFFFSPERAPIDHLFCGLHIEKGLDPKVAPAYPSAGGRRLIMKENWTWFDFFENLDSGKVQAALAQASKDSKVPILIRVEAGVVEDPGSFDPHATRPKWDTIIFRTLGDSLDVESTDTASNLLTKIGESKNLKDLAGYVHEIPKVEWIWLDIFLGIMLGRSPSVSDPDIWDERQLWSNFLSKWIPWLK